MHAWKRTKDDFNVPLRAASHSRILSSPGFYIGAGCKVMSVSLVMLVLALVHCLSPLAATAQEKAKPLTEIPASAKSWPISAPLPPAAEDMRQAIESAIHSGDIEELKVAFDLGELKADIADEPVSDPVAFWKKQSSDGEGREILAILANLLSVGAAEVARGQDPENNAVYVWPYLAELPLDKLTASQKVDLLRLVPAAEAKAMQTKKTWTWWRLTIGADGLWHVFKKTS